jgi:DNA-binding CsgD family transcriptional regulator
MINSHVEEILPLISTPVLIITPRNMPNPPFLDNSRAYASLITNSQLILYDHDFWDILSTGGPGKPSALSIIEGFVAGLPPAGNRPTAPPATAALPDGLSERELEVLRLVAAGKSNPEIAKELFITRNTVQNHVSSILIKTNLGNRTEAAVYARDHGLV